jgi:DMSO/TMAO reductase YedYZ molybdopterin-dependent catalytic subunit
MNAGKPMRLSFLLGAAMVAACAGTGAGTGTGTGTGANPSPAALQSAEIGSYHGQNLSALSDVGKENIAGVPHVSLDTYRLKIDGLVGAPQELTYDQVLAHDHFSKVVTLNCVSGWDATILWEGVRITDILADAGVQSGAAVPSWIQGGEPKVVIFHGVDGYTSALPLSWLQDNDILLAYKMNGVTIPAELGFPFQVVAESKWGYKWVKWVNEIELSNDTTYKGYWERGGYSNNGDVNGPMFEP